MHMAHEFLKKMKAAFHEPRVITCPAPWAGHIPFAMWLLECTRPRLLVELGTYSGISYLAFCEAVERAQLNTRCFAVDTWQGDEHAGRYGEHIYQTLRGQHDPMYSSFSTLLRQTFDAAQPCFEDGSIDLLHIDGLHTYDAVRHDFETWRCKLSERAVVLFHDTEVRKNDFGVWKFWAEISACYPSLAFRHSNGLGVLFVGEKSLQPLLDAGVDPQDEDLLQSLRLLFEGLGASLERRADSHGLQHELHEARHAVAQMESVKGRLEIETARLNQENSMLRAASRSHQAHIAELQGRLDRTFKLRSKKVAKQAIQTLLPVQAQHRVFKWIRQTRSAVGYVASGQFGALVARAKQLWSDRMLSRVAAPLDVSKGVGILTTPHTLFIAHSIKAALEVFGIPCSIIRHADKTDYPLGLYFVLCAQMFKHLPPGEKRIVFQLEQTVSDRWFDERYLQILNNSRAVLEYSLFNLKFLSKHGVAYPHVFHVPVGGLLNYGGRPPLELADQNAAPVDVLFYGDANSDRRRKYLKALQERFDVQVVSSVFGEELRALVARAKVVVNIHFYENALLESTRIYECLSLGAEVVSEAAQDLADYPGLEQVVAFVPVDDVQAMIDAVERKLQVHPTQLAEQKGDATSQYLVDSQDRFRFMFNRMLLAQKIIDFESFEAHSPRPNGGSFVLSMPETHERRALYLCAPVPGVSVFDGLRARPGWVGCALSYKYLCKSALEQGFKQLLVCEDDVELPSNYEEVITTVRHQLNSTEGHWDVFVGIIAHLHEEANVLDVQRRSGLTFVTLDKMTSMVFNIYSEAAMRLITNWDETNEDAQTNTIDRYLERAENLKVVTLLEPLFGHRDEANSTLWGFANTQYQSYIEDSRALLGKKVDSFLKSKIS